MTTDKLDYELVEIEDFTSSAAEHLLRALQFVLEAPVWTEVDHLALVEISAAFANCQSVHAEVEMLRRNLSIAGSSSEISDSS